jgi:hypothetical protein
VIAEVKSYNPANVVLVKDSSRVELATYGIQGPRGNAVLSGNGVPHAFLGINSDLYLDLDNGFMYKKIEDTWEYQLYTYPQTAKFVISPLNVTEKQITLYPIPNNSSFVTLEFLQGGGQENGVDFNVVGGVLSWNGLGLDGFIESGDIIIVKY